MNPHGLTSTLAALFGELLDGSPPEGGYMLNGGDVGLVRSLDRLTAEQASAVHGGGATIAAHVDHLRFGLSLMNTWSAGEDPFGTADWSASWRKTVVSDDEWLELRAGFEREARRWLERLGELEDVSPHGVSPHRLKALVGSLAHLAYHLGAIRQIDRAARGPAEPPPAR